MFAVQRFSWQKTEDGPDPSAKWGKDLLVTDTEDPDDEDYMPIPYVGSVPATSKTRASMQDWSDDDDCEILEVYDPCPISFLYSLPSTSAWEIFNIKKSLKSICANCSSMMQLLSKMQNVVHNGQILKCGVKQTKITKKKELEWTLLGKKNNY